MPFSELECKIDSGLDSVAAEDLRRLFPPAPDSVEMIQLTHRSGFDGFSFYHVVVRHNGRPILLLPLFETRFDIAMFLEGLPRRIFERMFSWLPSLLHPRVLIVGFVEGEWGEVGYDRTVDKTVLSRAWDFALAQLRGWADERQSDILGFLNFNEESGRILPMEKLANYSRVMGMPCAQLEIPYTSVEEYTRTLSKNMRKSLRKTLRRAEDIRILRTQDPRPWLEEIYRFYRAQTGNSPLVFGVRREDYFSRICDEVPGAEYVLYFLGERLVAFNLLIATAGCLVDKYFSVDPALGHDYHLYFVSWIENVRHCVEKKIPLYHAGQTAEMTKARLGSKFYPSMMLFKHRNPFLQFLLNLFKGHLAYTPQIDLSEVNLGSDWEKAPVPAPAIFPDAIPAS